MISKEAVIVNSAFKTLLHFKFDLEETEKAFPDQKIKLSKPKSHYTAVMAFVTACLCS